MSSFLHQKAGVGRAPRGADGEVRKDEQQAVLLNALRVAAGAPVSYAELRDAGIEFPAGVVSGLEVDGVPLQWCRVGPGGGPGVRLEPALDLPTGEPISAWSDMRVHRAWRVGWRVLVALAAFARKAWGAARALPRPPVPFRNPSQPAELSETLPLLPVSSDTPSRPAASFRPRSRSRPRSRRARSSGVLRWLRRLGAVLVLAAVIGAVTALVLKERASGPSTGASHTERPRAGARPKSKSAARAANRARSAHGMPPLSPALAAKLEASGFGLVKAGHYSAAVPVLERAVQATGKSAAACVNPVHSACLTYARAMYNLGHALRLSGHPAAAVPVLERRLRVHRHRGLVEAELRRARGGIR